MALSFEISGAQIDGKREYQEDAFLITNLSGKDGEPCSLMIVADGMGGHAAGNIASNMAVQAFSKHVTSLHPSDNIPQMLSEGIMKANHSIAAMIKETPALDGMGCTLVGVLLQGNHLWWASVGDSHLYLLRSRELSKLNADHSYGGFLDAMKNAGTPVEPEPGLSRNMLMSAITGGDISEIDCPASPLQIQAGDKVLVGSDGINTLSTGKIIQYCDWSDSPKECVDALMNAVEDESLPKQDNATAIAVYIIDHDAKTIVAAPPAPSSIDFADEDITSPSQVKKPAVAASPVMPVASSSAAPVTSTAPSPQVAPVLRMSPPVEQAKSNKNLILAVAAGLIIAAGIGAFLKFGSTKPASPPSIATTKPGQPEVITGPATDTGSAPATVAATGDKAPDKPAEQTIPAPSANALEDVPVTAAAIKSESMPKKGPGTAVKEFRETLKDGSKGPVMIWIPGGSFVMGSPGSSTNIDERPSHTVKIKKFAISKFEVTISEYEKYAKAAKNPMPDDLYMEHETSPVIFVKWDDAFNYAKWLSEQTGQKYRLPSEAEWEYAAAGGRDTPFWWGYEEKPGMAHCFACESQFDPRKPAKIGQFPANPYGLYDISGNVSEWVYDCWHDSYKDAPSDGSVWEGGDCSQRIARGGSYISPQQSLRVAKRDKFKSDSGYDHVGIRLARDE